MPNYFVWTKHGEIGVMLEGSEEEQNIPDFAAGHAFVDTTMGEADEDESTKEACSTDAMVAHKDYETMKESEALQH